MHCAIFFKYTPYNIVIHIQDVLENYVKFKGNLKKMLGFVMLSEDRDVAR